MIFGGLFCAKQLDLFPLSLSFSPLLLFSFPCSLSLGDSEVSHSHTLYRNQGIVTNTTR